MTQRDRWRDEDQRRFREDDWDRDYGRRREEFRDYGRFGSEADRQRERGFGGRDWPGRDWGARGRYEDERGFGGRERDYGDSAGYGSGGSALDYRDVVGDERRRSAERVFGRGFGRERDDDRGGGAMERAFGRGFGRSPEHPGWRERSRDEPYGREHDERGLLDRAGDEVASWFGDDDAARRRRQDAREGDWGAQHHRGRGPRNYQRSDERIREDVNDRLTDDPHVDASHIEVAVKDREVTLTGTVRSRFEKRHAEDIAEAVSGVTHVQNNLRVDASAELAGRADSWA